MKKKLNVMVPVDFTPVSFKALEFLSFLMEKTPIETHLVHVVQVNAADWAGSTEASETIDRAEIKEIEQKAEQQFRELKQHVDFKFQAAIVYGGLTTALASYAAKHQPDLMIMGTAGAQGWQEKVSGSEAQQVVRHTEVPVITIHQHASITPIHHILWVADFEAKKQPERAVATVKTLQQLFGAQLHLLRIIRKQDEPRAGELKQHMQQFAESLQLQHYELHLRRDYIVPEGVRNFNRETEMDLVVIGTHARKGFSQLFYGSIAETLVNRCIRPLLTYHLK
ncbi:universal stress protein [Botryobacter ruber]|uniref:universal stress protein n=1 Tax=Botryobacter ruber TaxID=2171629 RepID=UPI000E0A619C|nr:universal stress protein [Botryobacter ruber]